jgi:hypothetical protein
MRINFNKTIVRRVEQDLKNGICFSCNKPAWKSYSWHIEDFQSGNFTSEEKLVLLEVVKNTTVQLSCFYCATEISWSDSIEKVVAKYGTN